MIKMTYIADGEKTELNFDTVEDFEKFEEHRHQKLQEKLQADEEAYNSIRRELTSALRQIFVKAREAGVTPDDMFSILTEALSVSNDEAN